MNNSIEYTKLISNINSITISREQQKELIKLLGERIGFYFPTVVWKNITDFMLERDNRKYAEKYFNDIISLNKNLWNKKADKWIVNYNKDNYEGINDGMLEETTFYCGRTNNDVRNKEVWEWYYKNDGDKRFKKGETYKPHLHTKMVIYLTNFKFVGKTGTWRDFKKGEVRSFSCVINANYYENGIKREKRTIKKTFNKRTWNGFKKGEELIFIDRSPSCWDWKLKCLKNPSVGANSIGGLKPNERKFNKEGIIYFEDMKDFKCRNNIKILDVEWTIESFSNNDDKRRYRFNKLLDEKRSVNYYINNN